MLRRVVAFVFMFCILAASRGQDAHSHGPQGAPLQSMLEILDNAKLSGSLVFSGRCDEGYTPDFPHFGAPAKSGGAHLQDLRELFVDHPATVVTQDPDGTIRMIERGVPTDVLNIRISHISFGESGVNGQKAVYNPDDALSAILHAPEVVSFMKARGIERPFRGGGVRGNSTGQWPPDQPHISGSLDDVTVSSALDFVLRTFPGIWAYENCPQTDKKSRDIYFGFFYLQKVGSRVLVVE